MAETPSTMAPLGIAAPHFKLPDTTTGKQVSLDDFRNAPALLVAFICNHCPFVKHIRSGLAELGREYQKRGVAVVGISSNDATVYSEDSPKNMAKEARQAGYTFPYLYDESQEVAKAYRAACTPDFYLFDGERKLVYRGQMDDSRPGNGRPVTGNVISDRRSVRSTNQMSGRRGGHLRILTPSRALADVHRDAARRHGGRREPARDAHATPTEL